MTALCHGLFNSGLIAAASRLPARPGSGSRGAMQDEREYVIGAIGSMINGSIGADDWQAFTTRPLESARLDWIRRRAGRIALPVDAKGELLLRALLQQAERLSEDDPTKVKAWRMEIGLLCGLLIGAGLWAIGFVPGGGWFQNPHLLLLPAAAGVVVVIIRNRREQVGFHDPETMDQNKRGRI